MIASGALQAAYPIYPTEVDTARRCWRRWLFRYGYRIKKAQRFAGELGDQTHDLHQRWNKLSQAPEPGRSIADNLLVAALPWCPLPHAGTTEGELEFALADGTPFRAPVKHKGRLDWRGRSSELPKFRELSEFGDTPAIMDLKTGTDPLKHGIWTREKFLQDSEVLLYGLGLLQQETPEGLEPSANMDYLRNSQGAYEPVRQTVPEASDVVAFRWLYMKKPPKDKATGELKLTGKVEAMPSDLVLGRDALNRAHLKLIAPYSRGIEDLRQQRDSQQLPHPVNVPYNLDACLDYGYIDRNGQVVGGCDYQEECKGCGFPTAPMVSAGYAAANNGESEMTSYMQQMEQQPQQPQAPQYAPPPAPGYAPPPPPAQQYAPPAAPQAPVYAPPAQQAPAQQYAPPAAPQQQQPPQYAPPAQHPGFQGVNPPEVRAPQQQQYAPPVGVTLPPAAPAPAANPSSKPSQGEVLAALDILARFFKG